MISPYVLSMSLQGCTAVVAIRNIAGETDSHVGICPPRNDGVCHRGGNLSSADAGLYKGGPSGRPVATIKVGAIHESPGFTLIRHAYGVPPISSGMPATGRHYIGNFAALCSTPGEGFEIM